MSEFSEYLSSEVVVDYADGLISRREALHRLALLGVGAAVAAPLLAACDAQRADTAAAPTGSPSPRRPARPGPPRCRRSRSPSPGRRGARSRAPGRRRPPRAAPSWSYTRTRA
ncbi:hypothetical protein ACFQY4_38105 [Catellatospora bangladeshensis]|uniref:hypothetical protein n=1 Tax=Catellatospora bangladeshensis TaxID=310355 RepID=UPI003610FD41